MLPHHPKSSPQTFKGHKKIYIKHTQIHVHTVTSTHILMHTHTHAHTCYTRTQASRSAASSKFQLSFPDSAESVTWICVGAFLVTICQWPTASPRVLASGNVQHSNIEVVQLVDRACLSSSVLRPLGVGVQQPRKSHLHLQGVLQPSIISLPKSSHCGPHHATDGLLLSQLICFVLSSSPN